MKYLNDHIKSIFDHHDEIPVVEALTKELFGETPEITAISKNRVYKVDVAGKSMKACFRPGGPCLHKEADQVGISVPKIEGKIEVPNSGLFIKFSEWIEGDTYRDQLAKATVYDRIPLNHYYQMGEILGGLSNIKIKDGRRIGMSDIYWLNFIIDLNDKVWLIDTNKLYPTNYPEYFVFIQLLFHPYTPVSHKRAFIEGYLAVHDKRKPNEQVETLSLMIKGLL